MPCPANPLEINHLLHTYKAQAQPAFLFHNSGYPSVQVIAWHVSLDHQPQHAQSTLSKNQFLRKGHDFSHIRAAEVLHHHEQLPRAEQGLSRRDPKARRDILPLVLSPNSCTWKPCSPSANPVIFPVTFTGPVPFKERIYQHKDFGTARPRDKPR